MVLLAFACKQTSQRSSTTYQSPIQEKEVTHHQQQSNEGTPMSDSTVAELLRAASPEAKEPQQLDFSTCELRESVEGLQFDMAAIGKYHNEVENYVEYCLYSFVKDGVTAYLIFNNEIESHYSPYFKLLKVRGDDTLSMTTIAQIYGNEQYDFILSAKGISEQQFELTKQSTFRYIHGLGKVDSTITDVTLIDLWN